MRIREFGSAVALIALAFSGVTTAAASSHPTSDQMISGFIVQYEQGIEPFAQNGEPTGSNLLKGKVSSEDLGGGLYVLELDQPIKSSVAEDWIRRMELDRRIAHAVANFEIAKASFSPTSYKVPEQSKARPASAPKSLTARDGVTFTSPARARVRLKWKAPSSRYGAKVVGYQIQYSSNGGASYKTLINNTGSSETRAFVSDGIRAGIAYRFRVRAITNDGSAVNTIGAASAAASVTIRTSPKPAFVTTGARVGPGSVSFLEQSLSDRGGYSVSKVRYSAVATSPDLETVEASSCSKNKCLFPDLVEGTEYTVEVFASNSRGISSSSDAVVLNDQLFQLQWHLTGEFGVSMPSAWKYSRGDGDKVVAVIDTGIKSHEQIDGSLTTNSDGTIYGYDFVSDLENAADGDAADPDPNDEGQDESGVNLFHGTHVAGIISASHDYSGIAGVAPNVKVLPVRALGNSGGNLKDLVQAIRWAAGEKLPRTPVNRYPVSVINLSLGATESAPCSGVLATVIEKALAKGITIVVAAGNDSRDSLSFPANCKGVVSVAATQSLGDLASYSNYGAGTFISAPGGEINVGGSEAPESYGGILSAWINDSNFPDYRVAEGTSMAAPVVSGIVALMYSMQPSISPSKVRGILKESVQAFPAGSNCQTLGGCGAGIIDAQLALARTSVLK